MSEKIKKGRGPNRLEALIPIVALLAIMIMNYIFNYQIGRASCRERV